MKVGRSTAFKVVLIASLIISALNLSYMLKALAYPYELDYSEGIYAFSAFSSLGDLYGTPSAAPYTLTYYPPLYYLINSFRSVVTTSDPYLYLRFMTLISLLADSVLIYLISKNLAGAERGYSALAAILFLSIAYLTPALFSNPTVFELTFDLLALLLVGMKDRHAYLSALSLSVAFFFKQSALVMFVAILLYLVVSRERRPLIQFAGTFATVVLSVSIFLNFVTGGNFVFQTLLLPLITPELWQNAIASWTMAAYFTLIIPILFAATIGLRSKRLPLIAIALVAEALSTLSIMKAGSSMVYLIPMVAVACIASSIGMERIFSEKSSSLPYHLFFWLFIMFSLMEATAVISTMSVFASTPAQETVGVWLRNVSGNVLVEDPGVALAANKPLVFEPSMLWVLEEHGLWNDSAIIAEIRDHDFGAIAYPSGGGRFSYYPDLISTIKGSYNLTYYHDGWCIYTYGVVNGISRYVNASTAC